ncbi:MAG: UDP-N-acetylglucosamine 2-epimerase [Candidatus Hodarchaeota archaeon]
MKYKKKILFLTGTRADFGKLKRLMQAVEASNNFELLIFVTGMHTLSHYGLTGVEVHKAGFSNIHTFINQLLGEPMELILANTISGLSRYVHEHKPDMIVVHGDRIEALAGAIVGALCNILVAHVEGGERSGTIDDLIRHSVTKLSHIHFVANEEAANRLRQLGEDPQSIFVIGSPDIDLMLSPDLPTLEKVKKRYEIDFEDYGIVLFHPVTTELEDIPHHAEQFVSAILESECNYVILYPNNDEGCRAIFAEYERLKNNTRFRLLPSLRFEYFLTLLKHTSFIIGNSSAGIREAPVYAVYSINVGTRQNNRFHYNSIINVSNEKEKILEAIEKVKKLPLLEPSQYFGDGKSTERFMHTLDRERIWQTPKQKQFYDLDQNNTSF